MHSKRLKFNLTTPNFIQIPDKPQYGNFFEDSQKSKSSYKTIAYKNRPNV